MKENPKRRNGKEIIILLLIFIIVSVGCVGNSKFVGTWKFTGGEMIFSPDGTGEMRGSVFGNDLSAPFTYKVIENTETIQITGEGVGVPSGQLVTTDYHYQFSNNDNILQLSINGRVAMSLIK
jgi:hypothetical protein